MNNKIIITSESVGAGHPDKICDQISDYILDECLKQDPNSRVACETFASNRLIVIGGEITTKAYVDVTKAAWSVLKPLGYNENDFTILSNINRQSPDIAKKVNLSTNELGSGDQGIVFGYACNETEQFMPLPLMIAHALTKTMAELIDNNIIKNAKHDTKSQVSVVYEQSNKPYIDNVVFSSQHNENADLEILKDEIKNKLIIPVLKKYNMNIDCKMHINSGGDFIIGGPIGDTGLTGRKIIVDTYGGVARHGGGAFSGKDYTKVDRAGAYFARKIAKHVVASKMADKCEIQLAFCIGKKEPLCLNIDTFNTNKYDANTIKEAILKTFNFDLANVVEQLGLRKPIYSMTSVFGHFGKNELP